MKYQYTPKSSRRTYKVAAYLLSLLTILSPVMPSFAAVLQNSAIEEDFNNHPIFDLIQDSGRYTYKTPDFIERSVPDLMTVNDFYRSLIDSESSAVTGGITYVPIAVGAITTFIPVYDELKVIGTPAVQSRYIRTQISGMLGRTLINTDVDGYASEAEQIQSLYKGTLDFIQLNPSVPFGLPLPLNQEKLGEYGNGYAWPYVEPELGMIWPELRTINGQQVYVPVVYLSKNTVDTRKVQTDENYVGQGATVDELTISNTDLKAGRDAFINVTNGLTNYNASIAAEGDLQIVSGGSLRNLSSVISAGGDLTVGAQSIESQTLIYRYDVGVGGYETRYGEMAGFNAEGNMTLSSYEDINFLATEASSAGTLTLSAGGSILLAGQPIASASETRYRGYSASRSSVSYLQTTISAADTISLMAQGGIAIKAAEISSDSGHIELLAGLGVTVLDELGREQSKVHKKWGSTTTDISTYKTIAMRSVLDAGKGIVIHSAFGDITLRAADISSTEGTRVTAQNGAINMLMTVENDHYSYTSVKEGLLTIKTTNRGHNYENAIPNTIVGGFQTEALYGVNVQYEGDPNLSHTEQVSELAKMPGLEWMADVREQYPQANWEAVDTIYEEWDYSNTTLSPAAMAIITIVVAVCTAGAGAALVGAAQGITATAAATAHATAVAITQAAVTSMVTTATMASSNALVNGENLFEATTAGIEAVLSEDGLKSTATAMVTAGAISYLDAQFFQVDAETIKVAEETARANAIASGITDIQEINKIVLAASEQARNLSLGMQAFQAVSHSAAEATIDIAINGGGLDDFEDVFTRNLAQSAVNRLGQEMTSSISELAEADNISTAVEYIALAGAGCVTGQLTGLVGAEASNDEKNCYSGALGNVVGRFVSGQISEAEQERLVEEQKQFLEKHKIFETADLANLTPQQYAQYLSNLPRFSLTEIRQMQSSGVDIAKLAGAFAAFAAGLDVNIAADSSASAANYTKLHQLNQVLGAVNVLTDYLQLEKIIELGESVSSAQNDLAQIAVLLERFSENDGFGYLSELSTRDALSEVLQILRAAGYGDSEIASNLVVGYLSLTSVAEEDAIAEESIRAVRDRDWTSVSSLVLNDKAREWLENEFGAEYAESLEGNPSIKVKVEPWVAYLIAQYSGENPMAPSDIWNFYLTVRDDLSPEQRAITDSVLAMSFGGGQVAVDFVGGTFMMMEGGVEFGFDALDFVLFQLTGEAPEFREGYISMVNRYLNSIDVVEKLIDDPSLALDPLKADLAEINQLKAEGDHVLAGKKLTELFVKVVTITYGTGALVNASRQGVKGLRDRNRDGSSGSCSFHGDTLVKTINGFLPIKDIRAGRDWVLARNEFSHDMGYRLVTAQYFNSYDKTVEISITDSINGIQQKIVSNTIHPFYVNRAVDNSASDNALLSGAWIAAENLLEGDLLLNEDGEWSRVVSVKISNQPLKAYNLTVSEYKTYFVASNDSSFGVWVHNDCHDLKQPNQEIIDALESRNQDLLARGGTNPGLTPDEQAVALDLLAKDKYEHIADERHILSEKSINEEVYLNPGDHQQRPAPEGLLMKYNGKYTAFELKNNQTQVSLDDVESALAKYKSIIDNNAVGIEVDEFILYLNKDAPLPDIPGEGTFGEGPGGFLTQKNDSGNFIRPTIEIYRNGRTETITVDMKIIRRNFDNI